MTRIGGERCLELAVLVSALYCGALSSGETPGPETHVHTFTWRFDRTTTMPMVFFDGVEVGRGPEGCAKVREIQLGESDLAKVVIPDDKYFKRAVLACDRDGVIEGWLDKGIRIEFWWGDRKLDPVYISWTSERWDKPKDLVINSKIICPVAEGAEPLKAIKSTPDTLVVIMYPFIQTGNMDDEIPEAIRLAYFKWLNDKTAAGVCLLQPGMWVYPIDGPFWPSPNEPARPPGMRGGQKQPQEPGQTQPPGNTKNPCEKQQF